MARRCRASRSEAANEAMARRKNPGVLLAAGLGSSRSKEWIRAFMVVILGGALANRRAESVAIEAVIVLAD